MYCLKLKPVNIYILTGALFAHVCGWVCVLSRNILKSYTHGDGKHEIDLLWPNVWE